jgi:DNA invertase Pin-like site-specific DNA recombinase
MPIYYGYARISTESQSKFSIEDQQSYLEQRAQDLRLPFDFHPEVGSGSSQVNREVLSHLLSIVRPGDYIGVAYQDRFGRGGSEDIILLQDLTVRGINVELRGKLFDPLDPASAFSDEMQMIVAKFYSRLQRQKSIIGTKKSRESGKYLFASDLYGYRRRVEDSTRIIAIDPEEAKIIRKIFNYYQRGISNRKICSVLAEGGDFNRSGRKFDENAIRKVISNPIYMGYYQPVTTTKAGGKVDRSQIQPEQLVKSVYYEAIIEPELWWQVYLNRPKKAEAKEPARKGFQNRPYELTGLIKCAHCDKQGRLVSMIRDVRKSILENGEPHFYPAYTSRIHVKGCPTLPKSYKAEILENLFQCLLILVFADMSEIRGFFFAELQKNMKSEEEATKQIRLLNQQIESKKAQRKRVTSAISMSDTDIEELVADRERITSEIKQLEQAISNIQFPFQFKKQELEEQLRNFSVQRLQTFFAPETTGAERRKTYIAMIKSAVQQESVIKVTFHNAKSFSIQVHVAKGNKYQRHFLVEISYIGDPQGEVLIEVGTGAMDFKANWLTEEGKLGEVIELVEQVKRGDFNSALSAWEATRDIEHADRIISNEFIKQYGAGGY